MAGNEDSLRAEASGGAEGHCGVNAELSGGIRRGGNDAALVGLTTDDYGFAFERGIEELFDGDEEGVHVDVEVSSHSKHDGRSISV